MSEFKATLSGQDALKEAYKNDMVSISLFIPTVMVSASFGGFRSEGSPREELTKLKESLIDALEKTEKALLTCI